MKNATIAMQDALRDRAARVAGMLPPLSREASGALTPAGRAAVEAAARRILRRNRAVGACLVLTHGEQTERFFFGDARLRPLIPVTERTCFRVASISKLVMTFGFLALCERGVLSLDADISDILGFRARHPLFPGSVITPRMLLTHTAGLRDEGPYARCDPDRPPPLEQLLSDPGCWTTDAPGARFLYSNLGAGVAGVLMERAAGQPLDSLMQALVFGPLGIRAAYDPRRFQGTDDLADGYRVSPCPLLPPRRRYDAARLAARPGEPFDPQRNYFAAPGRMATDADGMAALIRLLSARSDTAVLSAASLAEMRAVQDGRPGIGAAGRALNCAVLPGVFPGLAPVGHQGVAYGMCAELFADPGAALGVGVMTSGIRLDRRCEPLVAGGFDLVALGFAALGRK